MTNQCVDLVGTGVRTLRTATPSHNEWGYSNRLVDLTELVASKL